MEENNNDKKQNEKAYKVFLFLENELEQDLKKSEESNEYKIHWYIKSLLNRLRYKYSYLIEEQQEIIKEKEKRK